MKFLEACGIGKDAAIEYKTRILTIIIILPDETEMGVISNAVENAQVRQEISSKRKNV